MRLKINVDKIASSTENVSLHKLVDYTEKINSEEGSVIVVKALTENPVYGSIELVSGRESKVIEGDVIVGTLGERRALGGFYGDIPEKIEKGDILQILNRGGVIGKAISGNMELGDPIDVEVIGQALIFPNFNERTGVPANITNGSVQRDESIEESSPIIMISASSMDSGKTTAACELIKGLTSKEYKVAAAKLTGVSHKKDTLSMMDYGACSVMDFNDAGQVSTTKGDIPALSKGMINDLNEEEPDCIVVELGSGILGGYGVWSILSDEEIMNSVKGHIICVNDLVAAWGSIELMGKLDLEIDLISGRVTDNEFGIQFIESEFEIPAVNSVYNPEKMVDLIEGEVFS